MLGEAAIARETDNCGSAALPCCHIRARSTKGEGGGGKGGREMEIIERYKGTEEMKRETGWRRV